MQRAVAADIFYVFMTAEALTIMNATHAKSIRPHERFILAAEGRTWYAVCAVAGAELISAIMVQQGVPVHWTLRATICTLSMTSCVLERSWLTELTARDISIHDRLLAHVTHALQHGRC